MTRDAPRDPPNKLLSVQFRPGMPIGLARTSMSRKLGSPPTFSMAALFRRTLNGPGLLNEPKHLCSTGFSRLHYQSCVLLVLCSISRCRSSSNAWARRSRSCSSSLQSGSSVYRFSSEGTGRSSIVLPLSNIETGRAEGEPDTRPWPTPKGDQGAG